MRCPSCRREMAARTFERLYGRTVTLDICQACQGLWFDDGEFLQLTPGATLELFAAIHEAHVTPRQALSPALHCARCEAHLELTHDLQRTTRFLYHRCPAGHGRFLTFFQFLRAKNFVRGLTASEIANLRRCVKQVNCSNCGAAVDLERDDACPFCRTAVSMLDTDHIRDVVADLQRAQARGRDVDPTLPVRLAIERQLADRTFAWPEASFSLLVPGGEGDLVAAGLAWLGRVFDSSRTLP